MKTTLTLTLAILFCAGTLCAAKYVDPLNGSDSNPGTMAAPFKTLAKIGVLASETVYITNSALCYVNGYNLNPSNVTLTSWGDTRPTIYLTNSGGTAIIYMNHAWVTNSFRMVNIKVQADTNYANWFIYPRAGYLKKIEIEKCEFDWSLCVATNTRIIHMRTTAALVRLYSNLVHDVTLNGYFVQSEEFPYLCDVRYNRFYNFKGPNPGIIYGGSSNCKGIIANNTAWGCNYLLWNNTTSDSVITNVNNLVEYAKVSSGKPWFQGTALGKPFCNFNLSGDSAGATYGTGLVVWGPSNRTALTETQIAFWSTNASDMYDPRFLKTDVGSVAQYSDAANMYPELNLPNYAGWAPSVPEPLVQAGLALLLFICAKRTTC